MAAEACKPVSEAFIRNLTQAQLELRVFVTSLVGNAHDAADVLQETNVDLWAKAETYDASRPFLPWAKTLAWYQVRKYRTLKSRERVFFSEAVVNAMAEELQTDQVDSDMMLDALESCLKKLTGHQRAYLTAKYGERKTVRELTEQFRHSSASVVSMLYRLRNLLHGCVEKTMRMEQI